MGIEGAKQAQNFESYEGRTETLEAPMSKEVLRLKNSIQSKLIQSTITPGEDIENYPFKWIDTFSDKYHKLFLEILRENPSLLNDWEDEDKQEMIIAQFKRKLNQH